MHCCSVAGILGHPPSNPRDKDSSTPLRRRMTQGFQTTRWTIVLQASSPSDSLRNQALTELVERNWYPLYSFLRHSGKTAEQSEDLLQGFFARVIEKNMLAGVRPHQRSRFRSFLLACLKNFAVNEFKYQQASIRKPEKQTLSIDFGQANDKFQIETKESITPQQAYDRAWALEQIEKALAEVRENWIRTGKEDQFEILKGCLVKDENLSRTKIAELLNVSKETLKVRVHRIRGEFRDALCRVISETLDDNELLEDEINQLFSAFRS